MTWALYGLILGVGATVIMDLWAMFQTHVLKIPTANYAMVGRWLGYLSKGGLTGEPIFKYAPIKGEAVLGWSVHYLTGVVYALTLVGIWGQAWLQAPQILPALIVAWVSLAAPFLLMQPGMGFGLFASKTPQPWQARLRSFIAHTSFGVGLYLAGVGLNLVLFA